MSRVRRPARKHVTAARTGPNREQETSMGDDRERRSAAQVTGADGLFVQLLKGVASHVRAEAGALDPATSARLARALMALQPEFRRRYDALFDARMGAEHAPAVLAELGAEPMQRYLRARAAMSAELERGLAELTRRMARIEL
jgi:hypothetical protein